MKDQAQYGPAQMLKEIREQEDSRYPANTTPKPLFNDNQHKNTSHYVYAIRQTDLDLPDPVPEEPDLPVEYSSKQEES